MPVFSAVSAATELVEHDGDHTLVHVFMPKEATMRTERAIHVVDTTIFNFDGVDALYPIFGHGLGSMWITARLQPCLSGWDSVKRAWTGARTRRYLESLKAPSERWLKFEELGVAIGISHVEGLFASRSQMVNGSPARGNARSESCNRFADPG